MGGLLHLIQRRGAWTGCGSAQSPPSCTKYDSLPINGQCTNLILFDVASGLWRVNSLNNLAFHTSYISSFFDLVLFELHLDAMQTHVLHAAVALDSIRPSIPLSPSASLSLNPCCDGMLTDVWIFMDITHVQRAVVVFVMSAERLVQYITRLWYLHYRPPPLPPFGHIWDVMLVWRKGNIKKTVSVLQYCVLLQWCSCTKAPAVFTARLMDYIRLG